MNELDVVENKIRKDPYKYLGKVSLELMVSFVAGYADCICNVVENYWVDAEKFRNRVSFQEFVQKKYSIKLTRSAINIIRFHCASEERAFNKYFEDLDKYREKYEKDKPNINRLEGVQYNELMIDTLEKVLVKIKERPGLYFGKPSLEGLYMFIKGYVLCLQEIKKDYDLEFHPGFQKFIEDKYAVNINKTWAEIIEFYCNSEEEAFYKYFELLDEFLKEAE